MDHTVTFMYAKEDGGCGYGLLFSVIGSTR